ncbi:MAG: hydratase [Epulopiscium sp. Nuni2H_MBin003]|nr:MAG: hydratase [Epulopiscium sp. Nuni2H_MBin003]
MIKLYSDGVYLVNGTDIVTGNTEYNQNEARQGTISYDILKNHNTSNDMNKLRLKFDALASHDITFVGIIQTAKASGLTKFPVPYVLTNCHNSLCAVGGTINEDDHMFGLSAAKKYGGIYVPPHIAVIHQYMREMMAGCGKMILGSDSHTRYGALGTMAIGEGGGELVKQILSDTYDISYPDVIAIYLDNAPKSNVGPQDIALAIIEKVFKNGFVKNKVMEFVGPGIANLHTDFRNGIDVMTTETTCLTSIWQTDEDTKTYLTAHNRVEDYKKLEPKEVAYYDGMVYVDLAEIKPMIALPFHPSNVYEIEYLNNNLEEVLAEIETKGKELLGDNVDFNLRNKIRNGQLQVDQAIIAGCAGGTYSSIKDAAKLLKGHTCGQDEFNLSVYPSSQPVMMQLVKEGIIADIMASGAIVKTAFCGPCFGAGDTPFNGAFSIRHTTRNFPSREGSKPVNGQISSVALMDARSIAATAINGGLLTPAPEIATSDYATYTFDSASYENRIYDGFNNAYTDLKLKYGPNIKDWPQMSELTDNILLEVVSVINDPVTTTDELIPSGEASSYRSNPLGLAEFTLSRRDPNYVGLAKNNVRYEIERRAGKISEDLSKVYDKIRTIDKDISTLDTEVGSVIYAKKPGDGSAREQAASCQRVLGGLANISMEYATKRYRSNLINWGMIPFILPDAYSFKVGDFIFVPDVRNGIDIGTVKAYVISDAVEEITLTIDEMTEQEKRILKAGSLINLNRSKMNNK